MKLTACDLHGNLPMARPRLLMLQWKSAPKNLQGLKTEPKKYAHRKLVGGIPTPLKNMKASWDHYSQYMEK